MKISFYNVNLTIFKNINIEKYLNQILNIVIYEKFIYIFYKKLSIYIIQIIKYRFVINNKFKNIRFTKILNIFKKIKKKSRIFEIIIFKQF